jgi:murein tripeptide amidase MpaA
MPTPLPTLTFLLATATALPVTALPATPPAVATLPVVDQAPARSAVPIPPDHLTRAELTGFRSTSSYDETLTFLRRLEKTSPSLKLDFYGKTAEGRPMPLVIVSKEKAFRPAAPGLSRKPVVLILNGIHAGEVDGKDACLMILRDLALGNRPEILEALTLLVVPIYNVDGHERVSPFNRPNQDGPVDGMGFRTTTQGLDLNRDFLKADAPETRALLALASAWQVDLLVDDHVTDGSDLQATLTTAWGNELATPAPLLAWMKRVVPAALAGVEAAGYKTAPYVEWADSTDPS